jgi:DNA modification methylase
MADLTPDLAAFIAAHAHPYDAATDTYRRAPFALPVKAGKNTAIYNAHSYHTKVPPLGIVPYIEHYTEPGDLILDPFCGSGMTGVAALMTGRHAILNDLSPAAVHIARNYCTPVDVAALRAGFERIRAAVKEEFDWLYGTTCDRCGGPATIQYTIWSDVLECNRCGHEIILWETAVDQTNRRVTEAFSCPYCGKTHRKLGLRKLSPVPVWIAYECPVCKPSRSTHSPMQSEIRRLDDIGGETLPYWTPSTQFDPAGPQYRRNALANRDIVKVTDLYTKRNLWALARIWAESFKAPSQPVGERMRFALTAIMGVASRRNRWPQQQTISGTIYVPSISLEMNVGEQFLRRSGTTIEAAEAITIHGTMIHGRPACYATVGSATHLGLPDSCVDYIFADPPFGSNLYYSEVNLLWEAWLQEFTVVEHEAVVHREQDGGSKRLPIYASLMEDCFREMNRVLKPGRWASVVFHNSDDEIWETILEAARVAGFELAEINAFDKDQLTFKAVRGQKGLERVTNKDIVLNLRKPKVGEEATANGKSYADEAEKRVVEAIAVFLETEPDPRERTLQGLWNHALFNMLRDGGVQVGMAQVGEMLPHYFKEVDGRWYLRGEAVIGGNAFDLKTDADAIAWLTQILSDEPQTTGELIPRWQAETAHLAGSDAGRLDRLLGQNFWQDPRTGRWRVPTAAERDKMSNRQSLADEAHLRVIRRFLAGDLDRRPSDWELSEWLRFCYRREAYAEAVALFPHIQPDQAEPERYKELKKIVAVCRMKTQPS